MSIAQPKELDYVRHREGRRRLIDETADSFAVSVGGGGRIHDLGASVCGASFCPPKGCAMRFLNPLFGVLRARTSTRVKCQQNSFGSVDDESDST